MFKKRGFPFNLAVKQRFPKKAAAKSLFAAAFLCLSLCYFLYRISSKISGDFKIPMGFKQ